MHFQEYFVRCRCEPHVKGIRFDDIETAHPSPGVEKAIREADAVIICPSNPFISIGPILAVPGLRRAIEETTAPVIAITPIVGGRALKGPAAEMMRDLGHEVSAAGVAAVYDDLVDVFVLDKTDEELGPAIEQIGVRPAVTDTVMKTLEDKQRLAEFVLEEVMRERDA